MRRIHEPDINTPEYYDKMWQMEGIHRFDTVRMNALCRKIKHGDHVLELGAGLFGAAQYAVECLSMSADFTAFDYSTKAREMVLESIHSKPRNGMTFRYLTGDVRQNDLPNDSYDVVIAGELIEHMEHPRQFAAEMARLCKPSGWIVISTVDTNCEDAKKLEYPEHLWEYTPEDLIGFFQPFGKPTYYLVGDYHMIDCQKAA